MSAGVSLSLVWILYWFSWRFFATMNVKTKFLSTFFEGLFRTPPDRTSHCIHIVKTSCCQLPARFETFCLLVEVVYWPYELKFVYPTINLALLGIIIKVKLLAKFCLHRIEWFCPQISGAKHFYISCLRYCDKWLVVGWLVLFYGVSTLFGSFNIE